MGSAQIDLGQPLVLTVITLHYRSALAHAAESCNYFQTVSLLYWPIIRLCPDTCLTGNMQAASCLPSFILQ